TDTEVIAHLIEEEYKGDLKQAVSSALKKVKGSYAVVVVSENEPDKLVGARKDSPLVVGVGDNENFFASDIPAVLNYTNRFIYLEDKDVCVLTKNSITVFNNQQKVNRKINVVEWSFEDAEKGGFPHFMLKEIYEQPHAIQQSLRGRISEITQSVEFDENIKELLHSGFESISIVACGTSFYAGLIGKYIIEQLAGVPVSVELASEYRYFGVKTDRNLVLAITQSGETADTLAALREAKNSDCKTLVITNVVGSTATRIADGFILTQSGPEIGVAATKTFTSQIVVLFLIALVLAGDRISSEKIGEYVTLLKRIPRDIRWVLERNQEILKVAKKLKNSGSVFFIGRGINYPLSLEGALKLKEISYIHAEGFPAGELKHGPFALLTEKTPVIAIVTMDKTHDKVIANIGEVKARKSPVIAIADENDDEIEKYADLVLRFPSNSTLLSCIPIAVTLQLLAYHTANLRGCEIDKPRNLAKSVTVE
ncbi:MAG TPA: glutamine--fructose-6-phosphate transaminase (isomerizing), partial [Thermoplasmatales archaeon]|nr:glutamine--fructose-6-phosphate transaminase (isomerizing) [Thermoplasmatales archaeon]